MALDPRKHGIAVCGGKGRKSTQTQPELEKLSGGVFDFNPEELSTLKYASRMAAKVDNSAIQDGYQLYHHTMFVNEDGKWAVVQQGMNPGIRMTRRYHWLSANVKSFVNEPHTGILCARNHGDNVLDMTARASEQCRNTCTDLVNDSAINVERAYWQVKSYIEPQPNLENWIAGNNELLQGQVTHLKLLPTRMKWDVLKTVYDLHPNNYEELLAVRGVGPATVRGLALISELLYGEKPSWRDPVKFSFAFGGKDGVPFPVNRKAMDEATQILEHIVNKARLDEKERLGTIRRLRAFAE
jgi:hypothetical protein